MRMCFVCRVSYIILKPHKIIALASARYSLQTGNVTPCTDSPLHDSAPISLRQSFHSFADKRASASIKVQTIALPVYTNREKIRFAADDTRSVVYWIPSRVLRCKFSSCELFSVRYSIH